MNIYILLFNAKCSQSGLHGEGIRTVETFKETCKLQKINQKKQQKNPK